MTAVAIIPARGGSRRIPRKNIRPFMGKPIIAYSIETAKASGLFERVVVSTEDEEIAEVAQKYGADVLMRPLELCEEHIGTQEVTAHALLAMSKIPAHLVSEDATGYVDGPQQYEYACCIYACAPMMNTGDLWKGLDSLRQMSAWYVMSVLEPLSDAGMFYWGRAERFVSAAPLLSSKTLMIPIHSSRGIDINTLEDWAKAEAMYEALRADPVVGTTLDPVSCEWLGHEYRLMLDVPHPDMIHIRCQRCGHGLPT